MFRDRVYSPSIDSILAGKELVELDISQLEQWLDEEMCDVYSFDLLSKKVMFLNTLFLLHYISCKSVLIVKYFPSSDKFCAKLKAVFERLVALGDSDDFKYLNF